MHGNNVGVYLYLAATHTTVTANTIADGYVGVLAFEGCAHTVIAGNTVRNCGGRGVHLNGAHHATVVGNVVADNGVGIAADAAVTEVDAVAIAVVAADDRDSKSVISD